MKLNRDAKDDTSTLLVNLIAKAVGFAYILGQNNREDVVDTLHREICMEMADILDDYEQQKKNEIAACN